MDNELDLLIVGAGPAGMSAAVQACAYELNVLVVDEQPAPGGQIWRGIETVGQSARASILGAGYLDGVGVAEGFRKSGATFAPETSLWHVERGPLAFLKTAGASFHKAPKALLLATGAQERSVPFPGWTLPGVMTVGAGQILLKSSYQIPDKPVWIAGCGPLAFLYAIQLLDAGAVIAGFLDTTPRGRTIQNTPSLLRALFGAPLDLVKGVKWMARLATRAMGLSMRKSLDSIEPSGPLRKRTRPATPRSRSNQVCQRPPP
jgi:NADPH-dependent 2,4-dienoyl-CoA reductase/sulfur reductase-like enzyme